MGYDDGDSRSGKFNSGVAASERLDSLQRSLNAARFNMLLWNPMSSSFNYQVFFESCNGLLEEGRPKFQESEQIEADRVRELIEKFLQYNPPVRETKDGMVVDHKNFDKLHTLLKIYEKRVKEFLDSHNLNNPDSDDDEGL